MTSPEPLPEDDVLYTLSNCVITPHIAGDDNLTRDNLYELSRINLINGLNRRKLIHQINI